MTLSQYVFAQTFEKISINTGFSGNQGKLTVADLDNDGDPDGVLVQLSYQNGLAVFKNNNGTFERIEYPYTFNATISSIDVGDVNRDGFIDVLVGGNSYDDNTWPSPNLLTKQRNNAYCSR